MMEKPKTVINSILGSVEEIDAAIKEYLKTEDQILVDLWKTENCIQLRSWLLARRIRAFDPNRRASIVEDASTEHQKSIIAAYSEADLKFPLPGEESKKEKTRKRIFNELGDYDIYDMLADVSKRLGMLERLTVRMAKKLKDDGLLTGYVETAYGPLVDQYVALIDAGVAKDRVDLEDLPQLFAKIQTRMTTIANIVDQEMFQE